MELKTGYKQTEVGVIPEEWSVKRLGEIATIVTGNTPPTRDAANYGDEFLFVSPFDLGEDKHIIRTEKKLSKKGFGITRCFPKDSILFVCIGSTIGKCGIAPIELTSNQQINAIFPSPTFSSDYLYYSVCALAPKVRALAGEQAVPIVNKTQFAETIVAFPPLPEQRAIAGALGDVDALLGALEKLTAKKRDLKQAAIQQLLTSKIRLPGFHGEWKVKRLGEIGVFRGGNGFPTRYQGRIEGDYPFFKVSDMNNEGNATFMVNSNNWISEVVRKELGANAFPRHSVVFAKIGAAIFLERKKILSRDSCIDNNMMGFMFNENEAHHAFIHYLFLTIQLGKLVSTTALPSLNGNELAELQFPIPPPDEQSAIAAVLSDMDAELAALEQRLAKTRALKQGMMQELLTGRVRLV
jgi:type I restriction enzyme S subunit